MFRERTVTFGGSVWASHIKLRVTAGDDEEEDGEFESLSNEDCPEVQSDNNKFSSDFSDMKLIEFPKILQQGNIKYLYLPRNKLTRLPSNLFIDLPNLEWFDVRNNALQDLPRLHSHQRIRTILAEDNLISRLPVDLDTAERLTCLQLNNNPLKEEDRVRLLQGLDHYKKGPKRKIKSYQHRESIDSGVDVNNDNDEEDDDTKEREDPAVLSQEEEIRNFIENKELYKCSPAKEDQENFEEFLYYYKSFHSPLLDKEFSGFTMEQIRKESLKIEKTKKEQAVKKRIEESLQTLKSRTALRGWRERYRELKREGEKRRLGEDNEEHEVSLPYDHDPDWTICNSQLQDNIFSPANSVKPDLLRTAMRVLEGELDLEVSKVIKTSGRPGTVEEEIRRRRSGRIGRLNSRLQTVRNKVRSVSAE